MFGSAVILEKPRWQVVLLKLQRVASGKIVVTHCDSTILNVNPNIHLAKLSNKQSMYHQRFRLKTDVCSYIQLYHFLKWKKMNQIKPYWLSHK